MKKIVSITLILCMISALLLISAGCDNIIDEKAVLGSVINQTGTDAPDATNAPENSSSPSPIPMPEPDYDYGGYSGVGDSGDGMASFSGGSHYESGASPASCLPIPSTSAVVLSSGSIVDILENIKLKPDGTIDTSNKNYINDSALANNLVRMKQELQEKKYNDVSFLTIIKKNNSDTGVVEIKLDSTYKNRTAYVYFVNENGAIVPQSKDKDYVEYVLDESHFANNILELKFGNQTGTFVLVFGSK